MCQVPSCTCKGLHVDSFHSQAVVRQETTQENTRERKIKPVFCARAEILGNKGSGWEKKGAVPLEPVSGIDPCSELNTGPGSGLYTTGRSNQLTYFMHRKSPRMCPVVHNL